MHFKMLRLKTQTPNACWFTSILKTTSRFNGNVSATPHRLFCPDKQIRNVTSISAEEGSSKTNTGTAFSSVPGPRIWPLLGNLEYWRKGLGVFHIVQQEQAKKYGGLYADSVFGTRVLMISDPILAETVYKAEGKLPVRDLNSVFGLFLEEKEKLALSKGLVALQGEEWVYLRRIFNKHLLKPMNIKNYFRGFSEVSLDSIEKIRKQRDSKNIVEDVLKNVIEKWSMESIGTFAFGQRVGLLDDPPDFIAENTYTAMTSVFATTYKLSRASWLKYLYRSEYKMFQEKMAELYKNGMHFVNNVFNHIKQCEEEGIQINENIGESLVAYLSKKDGMSAEECATHAIDTYAAGLDTTSFTTLWLMYLLGMNPEKQEKLYKEVKNNVAEDNIVTSSNIQKMPYLRACFKEAARTHPTVLGIVRQLTEDIVLKGCHIPAETLFIIQNHVMGRDEQIFKDADSFLPERWLRGDKNSESINLFASRPFGFGPRSCVGKQVVEAEMQVFISLLVKNLRFEYVGEKQMGKFTLFLEPEKPTNFAFYER